ncbi:hypothetical protein COO60DRAFT_83689 [Scenedesmus sp. NREL 46B-D3]|nr:hypothetical protein COO60DRAFT_83689 [Scenedesmus sp. NREL 46B-D3]
MLTCVGEAAAAQHQQGHPAHSSAAAAKPPLVSYGPAMAGVRAAQKSSSSKPHDYYWNIDGPTLLAEMMQEDPSEFTEMLLDKASAGNDSYPVIDYQTVFIRTSAPAATTAPPTADVLKPPPIIVKHRAAGDPSSSPTIEFIHWAGSNRGSKKRLKRLSVPAWRAARRPLAALSQQSRRHRALQPHENTRSAGVQQQQLGRHALPAALPSHPPQVHTRCPVTQQQLRCSWPSAAVAWGTQQPCSAPSLSHAAGGALCVSTTPFFCRAGLSRWCTRCTAQWTRLCSWQHSSSSCRAGLSKWCTRCTAQWTRHCSWQHSSSSCRAGLSKWCTRCTAQWTRLCSWQHSSSSCRAGLSKWCTRCTAQWTRLCSWQHSSSSCRAGLSKWCTRWNAYWTRLCSSQGVGQALEQGLG